jgi:hypothetical protein
MRRLMPWNVSNADWICASLIPQWRAHAYRSQGIPHIQLADQADSEKRVADFETRLRRAHFDIGCADVARLAQAEAFDRAMLDSEQWFEIRIVTIWPV